MIRIDTPTHLDEPDAFEIDLVVKTSEPQPGRQDWRIHILANDSDVGRRLMVALMPVLQKFHDEQVTT